MIVHRAKGFENGLQEQGGHAIIMGTPRCTASLPLSLSVAGGPLHVLLHTEEASVPRSKGGTLRAQTKKSKTVVLGAEQKNSLPGRCFCHDAARQPVRRSEWGENGGGCGGGCLARTKTNKSHAKVDEEKWGEEEGGDVYKNEFVVGRPTQVAKNWKNKRRWRESGCCGEVTG